MSYTAAFAFNSSSGLTLEAQLKDTSGTNVGAATTTGFVEEASSGWYFWSGTIPDGQVGYMVFRVAGGGAVQAVFAVSPPELEGLSGYYVHDSVQASPAPTTTSFAGSAALSSTVGFYNKSVIVFTSGALKGRTGYITSYTGSTTRTFTLSGLTPLPAAPTAGDTFAILGLIP